MFTISSAFPPDFWTINSTITKCCHTPTSATVRLPCFAFHLQGLTQLGGILSWSSHFLWGKYRKSLASWRFQPIWKICERQIESIFPSSGWTLKKSLKVSPGWEVVVVCHMSDMCFFKEPLSPLRSIYGFFGFVLEELQKLDDSLWLI